MMNEFPLGGRYSIKHYYLFDPYFPTLALARSQQ